MKQVKYFLRETSDGKQAEYELTHCPTEQDAESEFRAYITVMLWRFWTPVAISDDRRVYVMNHPTERMTVVELVAQEVGWPINPPLIMVDRKWREAPVQTVRTAAHMYTSFGGVR